MMANTQAGQASEFVASKNTGNSIEFNAVTGIVEGEKENVIIVKKELHDISEAMIIDEDGNIPKEKFIFYGKEVLILYQRDTVISVMILP